jgi:hypothetical protein
MIGPGDATRPPGTLTFAEQSELLQAARSHVVTALQLSCSTTTDGEPALPAAPVLAALVEITKLLEDLWDLAPELGDARGRVFEASSAALGACLEGVLDAPLRQSIAAELLAFASDDLAAASRHSGGEAVAAAQHSSVASSDEANAISAIVAGLTHSRRWRRWWAAHRLLDSGGPMLVDPATGDVDSGAVAAWMRLHARGPLRVL